MDVFTFNSGLYNFYIQNIWQQVITNANLPKGFPLLLNTTLWGLFLPSLPATYPDMLMEIVITLGALPAVRVGAGAADLVGPFELAFLVLPPGKDPQLAFTIVANVTAALELSTFQAAAGPAIGVQIGNTTSVNLSLIKSTIGNIDLTLLELNVAINAAVDLIIIPEANKKVFFQNSRLICS
jgi:hypothetical protein